MKQTNNSNKRNLAHVIYMAGDHTMAEIAEMVSLSERTIRNWAEQGNWKKERAARAITPQRLLDDLYMLVNQIVEKINNREGDKVATPDEAMSISRLADAIKKMQTDVGIVEIVGVGTRFINWMRSVDLDKAKEISQFFNAFLKDQVQ